MDEAINPKPLVSIMMTAYNRADYTRAAIESVLTQTYTNWELLVLDDGSTDNTAEVVKEMARSDSRIIYSPAPHNMGICKNRNRGLKLARDKYIAVLDCDDLWIDQEKLEKQIDFLESNRQHVLVGTQVAVIDATGKHVGDFKYHLNDSDIRSSILLRNQFTHSSILFRIDALKDQIYTETLPWEDYDLILRIGLNGKLANLPDIATAYRKHSSNTTKLYKIAGATTHLNIIKKHKHNYPNYELAVLKGWLRFLK